MPSASASSPEAIIDQGRRLWSVELSAALLMMMAVMSIILPEDL
jgi:hypothetical protein